MKMIVYHTVTSEEIKGTVNAVQNIGLEKGVMWESIVHG